MNGEGRREEDGEELVPWAHEPESSDRRPLSSAVELGGQDLRPACSDSRVGVVGVAGTEQAEGSRGTPGASMGDGDGRKTVGNGSIQSSKDGGWLFRCFLKLNKDRNRWF